MSWTTVLQVAILLVVAGLIAESVGGALIEKFRRK